MMKVLRFFAVGLAFSLVTWLSPVSALPAHAASRALGLTQQGIQQPPTGAQPEQQQQEQQQRQMQQEQQMEQQEGEQGQQAPHHKKTQLILTGKILAQHGHYMFLSKDTHTTFKISNPHKVKRFNGEMVKIVAMLNQKDQSLHVSKIEPATS